MAARQYSGSAVPTTLVVGISNSALTFRIANTTGWPDGSQGRFTATFELGGAQEEDVDCLSRAGDVVTVAGGGRGYDGTTGVAHLAGVTVHHTFTAVDAQAMNDHINGATARHAATAVSVSPFTGVSATNVQTALEEIVTDAAAKYGLFYNVQDPAYGAAGNGIADDGPAIQAAIDAAYTAGGGIVFFPQGAYRTTDTIWEKDGVALLGVSPVGSQINAASDFGAGEYLMAPHASDGQGVWGNCPGPLTNLRLNGVGSGSIGTSPCDMDGLMVGPWTKLYNVHTYNFRAGLVMMGDHNHLIGCKSSLNYYGVLYPTGWTSLGNHVYVDSHFDSNYFASVAAEGGSTIDSSKFDGCHFGVGPFGFYKFNGPDGANNDFGLLNNTGLYNCSFENVGNEAFCDVSTGTGNGANTFNGCYVESSAFIYHASYNLASEDTEYAVRARNILGTTFRQRGTPFQKPTGGIAAFHATSTSFVEISGWVNPISELFSPTGSWNANVSVREGCQGAKMTQTGTAQVLNGALASNLIAWNAESYDDVGGHDTSAVGGANTKYIIQNGFAGRWKFTTTIATQTVAANASRFVVRFLLNGAPVQGGGMEVLADNASTFPQITFTSAPIICAAGDYVQVDVLHNGAAGVEIQGTTSCFVAERVPTPV